MWTPTAYSPTSSCSTMCTRNKRSAKSTTISASAAGTSGSPKRFIPRSAVARTRGRAAHGARHQRDQHHDRAHDAADEDADRAVLEGDDDHHGRADRDGEVGEARDHERDGALLDPVERRQLLVLQLRPDLTKPTRTRFASSTPITAAIAVPPGRRPRRARRPRRHREPERRPHNQVAVGRRSRES